MRVFSPEKISDKCVTQNIPQIHDPNQCPSPDIILEQENKS